VFQSKPQENFIMNRLIIFLTMALVMSVAPFAMALDSAALVGSWQLVESAKDADGNDCPFVGKQLKFTADGKMISANMPVPFKYKVNLSEAETKSAITRRPDLEGMEIMLAMMGNSSSDWSKAPIIYGVQLEGNQFTMKVSGYTPARYKKLK
jgi:hypothetical protein